MSKCWFRKDRMVFLSLMVYLTGRLDEINRVDFDERLIRDSHIDHGWGETREIFFPLLRNSPLRIQERMAHRETTTLMGLIGIAMKIRTVHIEWIAWYTLLISWEEFYVRFALSFFSRTLIIVYCTHILQYWNEMGHVYSYIRVRIFVICRRGYDYRKCKVACKVDELC